MWPSIVSSGHDRGPGRTGSGRLATRVRSAALAVLATLTVAPATDLGAQEWTTLTRSRQISGESSLDVRLSYGAGRLTVGPAESGVLYRMDLRYDEEDWIPRVEYDAGSLEIGMEGRDGNFRVKDGASGSLELALAPDLPMDLRMDFGAARAELDLTGLALTELDLRTGASETVLWVARPNPAEMERADLQVGAADFTAEGLGNLNAEAIDVSAGVGEVKLRFDGAWQRDAHVSVHMGVGALDLRFPRDLGVRIERSTFLTSFDAPDLVKRGDAWVSENWDDARHRVVVEVDAAFGGIEVGWIR